MAAPVTLYMTRHAMRVLMRRAFDAGHTFRIDHLLGKAASGSSPIIPHGQVNTVLKAIVHREAKLVFDGTSTLTISDGDGLQATSFTVSS